MTRFLLSLDQAVDTVFAAVRGAKRGETYIPRVPAAKVTDIAKALIGDRQIEVKVTGIRPGEKVDEILISDEERHRTVDRGEFYAIQSILPELRSADTTFADLDGEYSSGSDLMSYEELHALLERQQLRLEDVDPNADGELLR
jgi:FlaA1/EpsC-like NDP-sugar epimerase